MVFRLQKAIIFRAPSCGKENWPRANCDKVAEQQYTFHYSTPESEDKEQMVTLVADIKKDCRIADMVQGTLC